MDGLCDLPQSTRPMVDGVHTGCDCEQDLRGADVRGGLLAADVLLSSLQRQAEAWSAVTIFGDPDEPARQGTLQACANRDESCVWSAVEQRNAEPLAGPDRHVRAPLARRRR